MTSKFIAVVVSSALVLSTALSDSGRTDRKVRAPVSVERPEASSIRYNPVPPPDPSTLSLVGSSTTITGFWDFQINGGACEMIRVNPANGNIHVIMMIAEDSLDQSNSRRTAYAMSTDDGQTWNNFNHVRVPDRRSGYPFLDLGRGPISTAVIIANHSILNSTLGQLQSTAFVDDPEGSGAFSELSAPPLLDTGNPTDEPVWPAVTCALDGSITLAPGRLTANTTHITRTADYVTWSPWLQFPGSDQGSARVVVVSSGTGRVAALQNSAGLNMIESTNSGASWPASPFVVFPPSYPVGSDSFTVTNGDDAVYNGDNILVALEATGTNTETDKAQIFFWSAATGIRLAVAHDTSRFISALTTAQTFQSTLGYPVIGMSGSTIVIVFAAFQNDISTAGYNYCDLWWTKSTDGGLSWSVPLNITNTPAVDERFPSISKYNPSGFAYIVWQEKLDPGSSVRGERPVTRASQKFLKFPVGPSSAGENHGLTSDYALGQNYPNPFNPTTTIDYRVAKAGIVRIKVFSLLGQEVATVVDGMKQAGSYQATFVASSLPSGVYVYQMTSGLYSESRKMLILR